ncbi:P-loop containing nucleoside triphosphate hydrolase protein [Bisporella sp. PMI_857]|nr:P-loop containing nucleoside triphosphate hydrolase protein [Bisporella sp. PMI_857]
MADFDLTTNFIPSLHKPAELLPIARHRESLLYLIETFPVTVVVGQTGCGKTTQIPQFLEKAGWCSDGKVIAVTQPRRVAATTVAKRVAQEMGCNVGEAVGYSIRFEDLTSAATRIKFLTDGLLLREALVDPLLSRYSVIMVDEAHERSLSTDILLGVLKKILKRRPNDLRIIISSATLQAEDFLRFFMGDTETQPKIASTEAVTLDELIAQGSSAHQDSSNEFGGSVGRIINLEGRMYPVDVLYSEAPVEDYVEKAVQTVFDIHTQEPDGDILVFLTGREEIDTAVQAISERAADLHPKAQGVLALPLYAGLSTEQQMYVFEEAPENTRKVIFSTNIAEASVTIDGIVYVIDTGFVKLRAFNPTTGIETLTATPVSKASATQRAGRAGRTKPGKCYRLYTEASFQSLDGATIPEIQRSNLAPAILQLKALGIDNIARFDFITPRQPSWMAELAVEPMMAKTLLSAPSFGCLSEVLTIAAMTSVGGNIWYHDDEKRAMETARRKFAVEEGDHLTLLNVYQAFITKGKKEARFCHDNYLNFKSLSKAVSIRAQLKRYLERFGLSVDESLSSNPNLQPLASRQAPSTPPANKAEQIRRCLTSGFFAYAAKMQPDGTFRNVAGGTVLHAHPSSLMFNRKAEWVIFHEVMEMRGKVYIRDISKIEKGWLVEYAPDFYRLRG